jgi:asparagine synthetase B (glutamine-hydrolysing)
MSESVYICDVYITDGYQGFQQLDGEFAIVLCDFRKNELVVATDPFGTKPCFYSLAEGIQVSTYPSDIALEGGVEQTICDFKPNSVTRFALKTGKILEIQELLKWSLDQREPCFDSWINAFESAVEKRISHIRPGHIPFLGISSGFDSGAIHAMLLKLRAKFLGLSIVGAEDLQTLRLRQRLSENLGCSHIVFTDRDLKATVDVVSPILQELVEDMPYEIKSDSRLVRGEPTSVLRDKASTALAVLNQQAKQFGSFVCLSGSGADEIISDYGFAGRPIFQHSNFGGLWPKDLSKIFPWSSFYGSTQQAYLRKEESVGGAFGIETRYPFLDRFVVQAYLNLTERLKNSQYKSPIAAFLESQRYPFKLEKKGFTLSNGGR